MAWITPKVDWTENDYYNAADLNRVENNTLETAKLLGITIQNTITNRDYSYLEFAQDLNRIENNIEALHVINLEWQQMKTNWLDSDSFSYIDANRLETNIKNLYEILTNNMRKYCGNYACGGDNI